MPGRWDEKTKSPIDTEKKSFCFEYDVVTFANLRDNEVGRKILENKGGGKGKEGGKHD